MKMAMTVEYKRKTIIDYKPTQKKWWITGFNPKYTNVKAKDLTVRYTITFKTRAMFDAFRKAGHTKWIYNSKFLKASYKF
jgi:hypothetical protein